MLAIAYEKMEGNYGRWAVVSGLDNEALSRAKMLFNDYKARGVIVSGSFEDQCWILSNQVKKVNIHFISIEGAFNKNVPRWIGCDCLCFQNCVKAFIIFKLGDADLATLRKTALIIVGLLEKTMEEAAGLTDNASLIIEFLELLPGGCGERDFVIEELEEKSEHRAGQCDQNQRSLADFNSYLKFSDTLSNFWGYADTKQKLFYFPLYFWWNLTAILPLRPTEFLLIPRNCLDSGDNGENILTVRRTKLKGGFKKHSYSIEGDYERKRYIINNSLANDLSAYLTATESMGISEIDTLFSWEPHCSYLNSQRTVYRYYTYACLKTCMKYFYNEVMTENHNGPPALRLGDTRHLAMASLIISGGSPVICKELAGHSNIAVSSHYYSNISNLVECVTIDKHRRSKGGGADLTGSQRYHISAPGHKYKVAGGWCGAPSVAGGDIGECLKVSAGDRHIGDCVYCRHYFPNNPGVHLERFTEAAGKQKVDDDCAYLMHMVELVRKGLGYTEDINAALLRLQHSVSIYGELLLEKYRRAENI